MFPSCSRRFGPAGSGASGRGRERERHRAFIAVDEAFASPWFPSRAEDSDGAIAIAAVAPDDARTGDEIAVDLRRRLPRATLLFGVRSDPELADRAKVAVLLGWS